MADARTEVTELATAMGTLGCESVEHCLRTRPQQMVSVSPEMWVKLQSLHDGGGFASQFDDAFANGVAFLHAKDGLRGRIPDIIEWKGAHKNTGDGALPIDLRIDHVYLISCKYDSRILHNSAPSKLFDNALRPNTGGRNIDWFAEVAYDEYVELWRACRTYAGLDSLPELPMGLTKPDQKLIQKAIPKKWPAELEPLYESLCTVASGQSAARWNKALASKAEREAMLWNLLRFGQAPYFMLGSGVSGPVRFRLATPWDWRQTYKFEGLDITAMAGGQPKVAWSASVKNTHSGERQLVSGFVEIRWSHGKFSGPAEAKVHMSTDHQSVPGYFQLQ